MTNEFVCEGCGHGRYKTEEYRGSRYRWYCARCEGMQSFERNEGVPV